MEILLWLAPAALATVVAAVLAGRAAAREEDERLRRLAARLEAEAARDADRLVVDDLEGVSAPRLVRTAPRDPVVVPEPPAPSSTSAGAQDGSEEERRSA